MMIITKIHKPPKTARIFSPPPFIIKKLKKECNVVATNNPIIVIKNLYNLFL